MSDEEASLGLGTDLVHNGAQQSAVAVVELGGIRVRCVKVVRSVLGLQQGQQTTANQELAVGRGAKMVRRVATGRDIGDVNEFTKGVL